MFFYQLLPPLQPYSIHQLRPRIHNRILPPKDDSQFIQRSLYEGVYFAILRTYFIHTY